jgi:flagellar biosynthesis protein FliQ
MQMEMEQVIDWSREAVRMALLLGGPPLIAALVVGLLVGIAQTLTQMHEPVVGLVPRLVAVVWVILVALPWLLNGWVTYTVDLIQSIPEQILSG